MNLRSVQRKGVLGVLFGFALAVAAAEPLLIELSLVGGKPEGGVVRTVRVSKDDKVALKIRSDKALTVHLHGYDLELRPLAGNAVTATFDATIVGRFPLTAHVKTAESHGRSPEPALLYLEVHPR
jgi:hypothetical protein